MALLKSKQIKEMSNDDITKKVKELKLELARARANSTKGGNAKIKEIKRTFARLITLNKEHGNMSKMRSA
jgi:large subunit ribosomal protein L29